MNGQPRQRTSPGGAVLAASLICWLPVAAATWFLVHWLGWGVILAELVGAYLVWSLRAVMQVSNR